MIFEKLPLAISPYSILFLLEKTFFFLMCLVTSIIVNVCPIMIHFYALDFNMCRSEEVISFCRCSVYVNLVDEHAQHTQQHLLVNKLHVHVYMTCFLSWIPVQIFHIDFGHFLGHIKKKYGIQAREGSLRPDGGLPQGHHQGQRHRQEPGVQAVSKATKFFLD